MRDPVPARQERLKLAGLACLFAAKHLPRLHAALHDGRAGYTASSGAAPVNGGTAADPTGTLALIHALDLAPDQASTDECTLLGIERDLWRLTADLERLVLDWLPDSERPTMCANVHGCPAGKPAVRAGRCWGCYRWWRSHGETDRDLRQHVA